jgi:hypothetical protein
VRDLIRIARVMSVPFAVIVAANDRLPLDAQSPGSPHVELARTTALALPGEVDSNSPAVWDTVGGRRLLHVMTSSNGVPSTASGTSLDRLSAPRRIAGFEPWPGGGGVWMEAVVADVNGTWYGYYHNEIPPEACNGDPRAVPRIGAARSSDRGQTWENLGVLLEAPRSTSACATQNKYFVGGVGDISVQLDHESRDLYVFFSEYLRMQDQQGVGVARLAWADRDDPTGKLMVWRSRTWIPASRAFTAPDGQTRWTYQVGLPIFPAAEPWHDEDSVVDAYWGPSAHWNTYLQQYVMLLNRAKNENFDQGGIYVSFAPRLDDPRLWSAPQQILLGGTWYPQVIGLEAASGTDKVAGEVARFFMGGRSEHLIRFVRP